MILPMTIENAVQISGWKYENEYAVYNFTPSHATVKELISGSYYVHLDSRHMLTGYFCFGKPAQIPALEEAVYASAMLDIGLGMKPELCGMGRGKAFVQTGVDYALSTFGNQPVRLTVAAFNQRAIRTYEKLGFRRITTITHSRTREPFHLMIFGA